jgi:hypothetical protein
MNMDINIVINTDNEAFGGDEHAGQETARILQGLADAIRLKGVLDLDHAILRDYNGNRCGEVRTNQDNI